MRRRTTLLLAVLIGAQLTLTAAAPQSRPGIGVNAAIRNDVKMKAERDRALRAAVLREPVHIGDLIASGRNSALQVLLRDQTVFTIGANARMTLDRFVYDPNRGTGSVAASVTKGAFRFMSGNTARVPGQVSIRTPVASIGVRGTIVELLVGQEALDAIAGFPELANQLTNKPDPKTATVIVLRGPGPHRSGTDRIGAIDVTAGGRTVAVTTAGFVFVGGPGQPPLGPFSTSPALETHLDFSLRTTPTEQLARLALQRAGKPTPGPGNPIEITELLYPLPLVGLVVVVTRNHGGQDNLPASP